MDLTIRYKDCSGNITKRRISDITVKSADIIEVFCHYQNARRTYNLSRILAVIDPNSGNVEKNFWKYLNISSGDNLFFLIERLIPAIKVLKSFSIQIRGFSKRERRHIVDFIMQNTDTGVHSEESIDQWLYGYYCGPVENRCDVYEFKKGIPFACQPFISKIPSDLIDRCREVAIKIAIGSGRKAIPPDLMYWIHEAFSASGKNPVHHYKLQNLKTLIILCFVFSLMPFPAAAGEMYTWVDENGHTQITDYPPDKPGRVINREKFRQMMPEEIESHNAEQNLKFQQIENEKRVRRQMNEMEAAAERAKDEERDRQKALLKARLERARRNIEDLEARKERYQSHENSAYGESGRMYWKDQIRQIDRAIMDNKQFIHKNTWP